MFNVGLGELLVIFAFVLVFWGPQALPEIGKNLGRFVRSMRDFARDVRGELGPAAAEFDELRDTVDSIKNPVAAFTKELMDTSPARTPKIPAAKAYVNREDEDDYLAGVEIENPATEFDADAFERSHISKPAEPASAATGAVSREPEVDDYLSESGKAENG